MGQSHAVRTGWRVAICVTLIVAPAGAQLPGVKAWHVADTSSIVDLSFTSSGGISLGAYQAGADWMIVELMRFLRDNPAVRSEFNLPHYRVTTVSGASAGNINSLITALHWCSSTPSSRAEETAYWYAWMNMGMRQLFPEGNEHAFRELGVLDRSIVYRILRRRLITLMQQPVLPECLIPVGVTTSKLLPSELPLNRFVRASVQRHVVTYEVATDGSPSAGGLRVVLRQSPALIQRDTSLGKQITIATSSQTSDYEDLDPLLELLKASSSVPFVLAPVRLAYCDSKAAADAGSCVSDTGAEALVEHARFVDGGTIDNAPLFLALRLLTLADSLRPDSLRHRAKGATALYVDYDASRRLLPPPGVKRPNADSALREGCDPRREAEHCGGIEALEQFMRGLLTSASQYELQSLVRARAEDLELHGLDIDVTTRYWPIVGKRLMNFAAFFGRPFREYDFHVGIYDALHFAASAVLCLDEHRGVGDTSDPATCRVQKVRRMLDLVPLSCASVLTVDMLLSEEYSETVRTSSYLLPSRRVTECRYAADDGADRAAAYRSVFNALRATLADSGDACARLDARPRLLCGDGLAVLFNNLRRDETFYQMALREAEACKRSIVSGTTKEEREERRAACFVDDEFVSLLRDPLGGFERYAMQMLDRVQWLEEAVEQAEADRNEAMYWDVASQVVNYAFRSSLLAARSGMIAMPSVVPRRNNLWRVITGMLVPQEMAYDAFAGGWAFGWSPLGYRWKGGQVVRLVGEGFDGAFRTAPNPERRARLPIRATAVALVGYRPQGFVSAIELGGRYWTPATGDRVSLRNAGRAALVPEVRINAVWDRLSLIGTMTPRFGNVDDRNKVRVLFALNDLGGAIYWILRSNRLR